MKYNIGAGLFRKDGWINIDNPHKWYKKQIDEDCLPYDLLSLDPLPIETETADIIYSSHVIEHITDKAAENMIKECCRVLKPGGVLRITAPDILFVVRAYRHNWDCVFDKYWDKIGGMTKNPLRAVSIEQKFLWHFASQVSTNHADGADKRISDKLFQALFGSLPLEEFLNHCTSLISIKKQKLYPGNHCNWWTYHKLFEMVKSNNFNEAYPSEAKQSRVKEMRGGKFDSTLPEISFFLEAVK